jgi:hypothetical protein
MEAHPVRRRIQDADECRDEPVVGERFGELVVDLDQRGFEVGSEPERHPEHRLHLRHRECGSDAVSGRIAQHRDEPLFVDGQVEGVPAGQLGRPERAVNVIAGQRRHRRGKGRHLDDASHFELLAHFLALDQGFGHSHPLQADCAASAVASTSSSVSNTPPDLLSTCMTPTRTSLWSTRGSVSMQRVR